MTLVYRHAWKALSHTYCRPAAGLKLHEIPQSNLGSKPPPGIQNTSSPASAAFFQAILCKGRLRPGSCCGEQHGMMKGNQGSFLSVINIVVATFTPSWFSVNMGTGIVANLLQIAPHKFRGMDRIANAFFFLNCFLFILFTLISIVRYTRYPWVVRPMLHHPVQSMFIGTFPMGLSTIISSIVLMAVPEVGTWAKDLAWVLWWINVVLALLSCMGIPFIMFHNEGFAVEKMTAAWLLPVVPAVVAGATGGVMATVLEPQNALITILTSYVLWGMGMGQSMLLIALYMQRLMAYKLPAAEVIVSAFLPLGPLGQGSYGIVQLSRVGLTVFPQVNFVGSVSSAQAIFDISVVFGLIVWAMGVWWLMHAVLAVGLRCGQGRLKFNMGFWGFVFPLGVFTAATITLGKALTSEFFNYLSLVLIVIVVVLWLMVTCGTVHGVLTGSLLEAPCMSSFQLTPKPTGALTLPEDGTAAQEQNRSFNHQQDGSQARHHGASLYEQLA
ncbi:hypothetical protein WJX74_008920 [Apatococcus lobatus]|uniref:Sulfite efflux pump SSU1 n=1 Tax=Apatococcus lobatus TaxID=904363 RepID=A0AAW1Q7C0_9CHLO